MQWKTVPLADRSQPWLVVRHEYLYGVKEVLVNEDNEVYCYNDGTWTAENTEIYVQKEKPTLLITLGESWTYGEGTAKVNHRENKWDISDKIELTYSGKVARLLDSDLWTFSCPGNSISGIVASLVRILDSVEKNKYESIKVLCQLTAPDRDDLNKLPKDHLLHELYEEHKKFDEADKVDMHGWFVKYEEIFLDQIEEAVCRNCELNLDVVVFKNFQRFWTTKRNYSFHILDKFWIEHNAEWQGLKINHFYVTHPDFFNRFKKFTILKSFDYEFINTDMDNWEKFVSFLNENNETNFRAHPNELSHALWTQYLFEHFEWPIVLKDK